MILAKLGLDGHDRGIQVVAQGLMDAGMEVVYLGLRQTPESVAKAALEEDADAVGVSSLSGAHQTLFPLLARELEKHKISPVLFGGGVIPDDDAKSLLKAGFHEIFGPGTPIDTIVSRLRERVGR
ncbi:MAG: cobalamin B12-binding domain-containing protein [Planctomycetota bacterium]